MNRILAAAALVFFNALTLATPGHAQSAPPINPNLKRAVTAIPIPGIKDAVNTLFDALKQVKPGEYSAKVTVPNVAGIGDIPLQLYFFGDADKQAILLVVNRTIAMPGVFNNRAWKRMAGTTFTDPIFSFSTVDFSLDLSDMSGDLKQIVANSYFNVDSLSFTSGFQLAARSHIGGLMKTVIEVGMGVPVQEFTMRAGAVLPVPMDNNARASLAISVASDMEHVGDTVKDTPEFYVEYQLAPGKVVTGPVGMKSWILSDATISMNNKGSVGYRGNISMQNGKKFITFFETPLNPAGAMDLLDFQFGMTAQAITLEDYANIAIAMESQSVPGGAFIKDIPKYKETLKTVLKPLSVFQLRNPKPVGEYKFGDKRKPFPPLSSFNLLILGPLASVDDSTGKTIQGPYLRAFGTATILGQQVGSMDVYMGSSGLHAKANERLSLKLGPLGRQTIAMAANADITLATQSLGMHGSVLGRNLDMSMSPTSFSLNSPATCLTPFALSQSVSIQSDLNVATLMDALPGVNVDPAQISGCVGEDLKKAYQWVATTGSSLGGYTANAANQELTKISNAAAEAARAEYNRTKDAARNVANQSSSAANNALKDAGNAFKGIGKKKKHHKGPDPKFAESVFDWDYYYDNAPDVVRAGVDLASHWRDSGFNEGRQGSREFSAKYYWNRYLDVQQLCPGRDLQCALQHWLDHGIDEGRQGSNDVSVASYLNRYPDLQNAFGKYNYSDALDHWLNSGSDEGRNPRPDSASDGPVMGPKIAGGGGGTAWIDNCAGQYVNGFRLRYGGSVDTVLFSYSGSGWGNPHGYQGNGPYKADVTLQPGEYIVRIDYGSGSRVDNITFKTNQGRSYGPYGGGGINGTYNVTPGEKLGCMAGRSGSSIDQLIFSSTGLH
ncbi:MAG: jacalin-like lectin [Burkholderiaceae bacterium]